LLNTTGTRNTASGTDALVFNSTGNDNTAVGAFALENNTADGNTAVGSSALFANTTGSDNTAVGLLALTANTGSANTAVGAYALANNTQNYNTAVGWSALPQSTGFSNVALGMSAGSNVMTASNVICIGRSVAGEDVSDSCYIGNIFNATSSGGSAVFVNASGKLGTLTSSRRFKAEIKPMDQASEALFALKPVTFRYRREIDPVGRPQFGLVAEDVEKLNPDLVVRDKEGKPYSVRYEQVNAMLLNEFLKEHRTVEEQGATIARLKKEIASLATTVREQAAQIQKVSAQVEVSSPVARMVLNSP
jgi:hypothetical protein